MSFRIAAVISHPTQHHAPFFRTLARAPGIHLKVFYCCDWGVRPTYDPGFGCTFAWDVPLLEGYEHEFLPMRQRPKQLSFWQVDNPGISGRLNEFAPTPFGCMGTDTEVVGGPLRQGRAAVIHFGDSELLHHRSWALRAWKQMIVRYFFSQCDAFISIGDNNEAYYSHYGVPRDRLFRGAYPVDVKRFQKMLAAPDRPSRFELRDRYGLPDNAIVVLFAGKLCPRKRPQDLLEAVTLLRKQGVPIHALFVGDGALRASLERQANEKGMQEVVKFTGFVNQQEIPLILECADLLAMTSEQDPHPLAVTESLIVGHPIVISDRVGCIGPTDTARPGVNALLYSCGDVLALAHAIRTLVEDDSLRKRMGEASRSLSGTQDVSATVQGVVRAILALRPRFAHNWKDAVPDDFQALANTLHNVDNVSHDPQRVLV